MVWLILLTYIVSFKEKSLAECNKVVSDIFGKIEFFDEISKYGFICTFCTIFESYDPILFQK